MLRKAVTGGGEGIRHTYFAAWDRGEICHRLRGAQRDRPRERIVQVYPASLARVSVQSTMSLRLANSQAPCCFTKSSR